MFSFSFCLVLVILLAISEIGCTYKKVPPLGVRLISLVKTTNKFGFLGCVRTTGRTTQRSVHSLSSRTNLHFDSASQNGPVNRDTRIMKVPTTPSCSVCISVQAFCPQRTCAVTTQPPQQGKAYGSVDRLRPGIVPSGSVFIPEVLFKVLQQRSKCGALSKTTLP